MKVTSELSLYPLTSDYESAILDFISVLRSNGNIEVHTHSMSTFVKGDLPDVMESITRAMDSVGSKPAFSLVMKMINRNLPVENGFLELE